MPKTVSLFIPTLNEIDGLKIILPRIRREWFDQILVVDGNSTDGTAGFAKANGCEVLIQEKKGLHHAYREGFRHVKGDIVITLSPDGNCIPELIPRLIEKMNEGFDMVICSRYARGAKSEDDTFLTGLGNWVFTNTINILHGAKYTDAMGIYRAYRTNLYYELELDKESCYAPEKFFGTIMGVEPLLSVRAAKRKVKIGDIPGDEPARLGGIKKLQTFRWGFAYMTQVFREIYYWK